MTDNNGRLSFDVLTIKKKKTRFSLCMVGKLLTVNNAVLDQWPEYCKELLDLACPKIDI